MGDSLRREVLRVFKKLHRTRLKTFEGDEYALQVVRQKINEEYRKYKNVTNQAEIEKLNKFAQEVEHEVRTTVIQVVEKAPGRVVRLTPDVLMDNVPYEDQKENDPGAIYKAHGQAYEQLLAQIGSQLILISARQAFRRDRRSRFE